MPTPGLDTQLAPLVRAARDASAVAVAAIRADDRVVLCHGTTDRHATEPVGQSTRFEIGSVTKTFTALLLADLAARGVVSLDDPLERHLPDAAPARHAGSHITLRHLLTHTSGLPRLPPGFFPRALPRWFSNPYARYTTADVEAALARTRPRRRPGARYHYSNFGVGLLGGLLEHATGTPYPDLLAHHVLDPLRLTATTCDPRAGQAIGYWHHRPRPAWEIPGLAAAGALRSTASDLLRYLAALLDPEHACVPPSLRTALSDVQQPVWTRPRMPDRLCLVWNSRPQPDCDLLHHSGATRGFTTFVGFSPQARVGLAALANTSPTLRDTFVQTGYSTLWHMADECARDRV